MATPGIFTPGVLSAGHQGSISSHVQEQDGDPEEREMAQAQSPTPQQRPQHAPLPGKVMVPWFMS